MKSYSQYYQDKFIDFLFSKKREGFFLDIGANDGITFSNTYIFEKYRDWKGLCIEPNVDIFEKCKKLRNCFLENCCISNEEKEVTFRKVTGADMLSGIVEYMDENSKKRIDNHINKYGGYYEDIKMKAHNINILLEKYNMHTIDFCSIDVEGGEYDIIKSIDYGKNDISAFAIEGDNQEITDFLEEKGYICIKSENDNFYVKKTHKRIPIFSLFVRLYVLEWKIWRHLPKWLQRKRTF